MTARHKGWNAEWLRAQLKDLADYYAGEAEDLRKESEEAHDAGDLESAKFKLGCSEYASAAHLDALALLNGRTRHEALVDRLRSAMKRGAR